MIQVKHPSSIQGTVQNTSGSTPPSGTIETEVWAKWESRKPAKWSTKLEAYIILSYWSYHKLQINTNHRYLESYNIIKINYPLQCLSKALVKISSSPKFLAWNAVHPSFSATCQWPCNTTFGCRQLSLLLSLSITCPKRGMSTQICASLSNLLTPITSITSI